MTIGNITTWARFAVLDGDSQTGLLGIDWLDAHAAVIDIANECLSIGNELIPFEKM
jgi:hypothetical protein